MVIQPFKSNQLGRLQVVRDALLSYEQYIRLAAFCGVFALMAAWELIGPRRTQTIGRGWRWPNNLGTVVVDTFLVRILFPTTAVGLALIAAAHGLGLFNVLPLPAWIAVVASVVLLDLMIYFQHVPLCRPCGDYIGCIMPISRLM